MATLQLSTRPPTNGLAQQHHNKQAEKFSRSTQSVIARANNIIARYATHLAEQQPAISKKKKASTATATSESGMLGDIQALMPTMELLLSSLLATEAVKAQLNEKKSQLNKIIERIELKMVEQVVAAAQAPQPPKAFPKSRCKSSPKVLLSSIHPLRCPDVRDVSHATTATSDASINKSAASLCPPVALSVEMDPMIEFQNALHACEIDTALTHYKNLVKQNKTHVATHCELIATARTLNRFDIIWLTYHTACSVEQCTIDVLYHALIGAVQILDFDLILTLCNNPMFSTEVPSENVLNQLQTASLSHVHNHFGMVHYACFRVYERMMKKGCADLYTVHHIIHAATLQPAFFQQAVVAYQYAIKRERERATDYTHDIFQQLFECHSINLEQFFYSRNCNPGFFGKAPPPYPSPPPYHGCCLRLF